MNLERLGEMTREERVKLYNRPDATHRKLEPVVYPEGVVWGTCTTRFAGGSSGRRSGSRRRTVCNPKKAKEKG